ncbi:AMP-binding protein [Micromonospora sp. NBC_00389]|uniref:AMP-binding protein n=1 Tax=Micromonospora sp. NBC_00389 TaxID=2903586 RepID=UPI002E214FB3
MDLDRLNVRDFLEEAVAENPDAPLLLWEDEVVSYAEFDAHVNRAAHMWHGLGVRRGDRVAFMVDNKPEFLYAWLGLAKLGATLVAVNTGFKVTETAYLLEHSEARIALVDPHHGDMFAGLCAAGGPLERVLVLGDDPRFTSYQSLVDAALPEAPPVDVAANDVISFIYTSGTTGKPKAVMQTHRSFVMTGQAYPHWVNMARGDRIYACLPLFHINSQAYSTMGAIGARGAIVLSPRFSASRFWDDIRRHRVAVFNFIGAMTLILSKKEPAPDDLDNDVKVAYGVPALPGALRRQLETRYGMRVISGFGMSETTFGLVEPLDGECKDGSMGLPRSHPDPSVPRTEARVVDEEGRDLPDGVIGELVLRGPALMAGYFHDPERTAESLRDGWLFTGDMAWRDKDGYYFFVDRKKDIIRRRGENVSSLEVEDVLNEHPAVLESAVVGVPSDLTDEELFAFIVARPDTDLDYEDLAAWAAERLAVFKVPRYYQRIDRLPKTDTQKIEKHTLRRIAEEPGERLDRDEGRRPAGGVGAAPVGTAPSPEHDDWRDAAPKAP